MQCVIKVLIQIKVNAAELEPCEKQHPKLFEYIWGHYLKQSMKFLTNTNQLCKYLDKENLQRRFRYIPMLNN